MRHRRVRAEEEGRLGASLHPLASVRSPAPRPGRLTDNMGLAWSPDAAFLSLAPIPGDPSNLG